jgi:tetratricopeptide (TPR) repeat protein
MRSVIALLLFSVSLPALTQPIAAQDAARRGDPGSAYDRAISAAMDSMMADPEAALVHSRRALALTDRKTGPQQAVNRARAMWLNAEALIGLNNLTEAGKIATEALAIVEKAEPGSKLNGDLLRSRGSVRALSGDVKSALADLQAAHETFRKAGIARSQAIVLLDLGQIYWEAGDYERTLSYYKQAVEIYNDDPGFGLSNHNNLGETYKMLERFADAEREYRLALKAARELDSPLLETRILSNLALVQIEMGKLAEASRTADRAEALARGGEAAEWRRFVFGVQARLASERGDYARAAQLLDQAFDGAHLDTTDLVYREFHELGAVVFEKLGQPGKALAHMRAFQRLESQARELTATASSQLMAAQFDFANQNLRISELRQGQLERDIRIERQRSEFRTMAFIGIAVALVMLSGVVFAAFRGAYSETPAASADANCEEGSRALG